VLQNWASKHQNLHNPNPTAWYTDKGEILLFCFGLSGGKWYLLTDFLIISAFFFNVHVYMCVLGGEESPLSVKN